MTHVIGAETIAAPARQTVYAGIGSGRWFVASYALLALGVFDNDGQYSPVGLALSVGAYVLFVLGVRSVVRGGPSLERVREQGLAGVLVLLLVFGALKAPALWLHDLTFIRWTEVVVYSLAAAVALAFVIFPTQLPAKRAIFVVGIAGAVVLRWGLLQASPEPFIDVFQLAQQGSGYLLHGYNPYSNPQWAAGHDGHIYVFNGYAYPPANLLLQSIAFAVTKDARFANVFADLGFALCLWLITRGLPAGVRQLAVLVHLYQPKSLFVLENAWTEPLTLGLMGVCLCLWRGGRRNFAAAVCGFLLTMKHYLVFVAPQYLILERRWKAWLVLTGTALTVVLPFLVWDAKSFWANGLWLVVSLPFSDQTLGVAAQLNRMTGYVPGPGLSIAVGLGATAAFPLLLRGIPPLPRFVLSVTGTLFSAFLFGTKAFCNYYYLVSGVFVLALALHAEGGARRAAALATGTPPDLP
jgi:hypothetical protein